MNVDVDALRKRVAGWKPRMTIEVRVDELTALLDLLDRLRRPWEQPNPSKCGYCLGSPIEFSCVCERGSPP